MSSVAEIFAEARKKLHLTEEVAALQQKYENDTVQNVGRQPKAQKQDTALELPSISTGYDPVKNRSEGQAGWKAYLEHTKQRTQNAAQAEEKPFWEKLLGYLGDVGPDTSMPFSVDTNQIAEGYQEQEREKQKPDDRWTEEQQYTFGYLWNTERKKAWEYAYAVNNMLNERAEEEKRNHIQQEATNNFGASAAHTAGAILSAPIGGLAETLGDMIAYGAIGYLPGSDGETSLHEYAEAVKSGVSSSLNDKSGTINEAVPIIGGKGWGDVYSLGTSIAQSLLSAHTGGQAQALITAFGTAVASGIDDAKARGAEDSKAIGYGVLTGIAEAFAEMIGVDNLLKIGAADSMKAVLKNILKQGAAESLEEGITSIFNNFADNLVLADKSNLNIAINDYIEGGMSREDAQKQAWLDMAGDVAFDMLGGFISGNVSGGAETVIQTAGQKLSPTTSQQAPNTLQNSDNAQETAAEAQPGSLEWVQGLNDAGKGANTAPQTAGNGTQTAFDTYEDVLAHGTNAAADPVGAAVEEFKTNGTVTNKQAMDILNNSKALAALRDTVGLELPETASGRRNAIKEAVARLAEQTAVDTSSTQSATANEQIGAKEHISMADFANQESPVWRNVEYSDNATKTSIMQETHDAMVAEGAVVKVADEVADNVDQAYPDLRNMKKKERTPILKSAMNKLKNDLRQFLNGFKNQGFEFEVNGKVLDATLYNTGIDEVLEKITKEKANMLYSTEDIFRNARYLYSTPDYDGDPNIYRWNYFYTPIQIGNEIVGVRIAVRDVATPRESQIYNWGIKKDASLGGVGRGTNNRISNGASSDASNNNISNTTPVVNTVSENSVDGAETGDTVGADASVGAAPAWFDLNTRLQYEHGTIPDGENPVRSDDLPKKDYTGKDVSYTARTVKGAAVTPDDFVDLLNKETVEGGLSYVKITNDATVQKAINHITKVGWKAAKEQWQTAVCNGNAGADLTAVGALLLNNAAKAGDKTAWLDILHDYQLLGTNTAQGLQAFRILKKLTPSDKLYMARRSVEQMVEDMKLDTDVTIDPELEAEYNNAETDAQRDAVLKKIQKNVAQQLPTTFMEKFTALRYVNMLGNLRTQGRNIVGNATMTATRTLHNAVATGIELIANQASGGKVGRTRSLTVSKEQMTASTKDFDNLQEMILDGGKHSDNMTGTGFARGVQEQKRIFKPKVLEGYRKVTNYLMETGDVIFAKHAYARALAGYLKANGITATDFSKVDAAIMDDARLFAAKEAQEATFRDTNWLSGWVSKIGRRKDTQAVGKLIAEGVMPFRKTPANVLVRAEEYSPLGVINSVVLSVKAAQNGSDVTATQVINSWAKTLTGTGIFGMGMLLQSLGLLSAGPDEDEKKEGFEDLNGWQNYALTLPDGTSLTIDSFSPSSIPLLMGAQFMRLINDNGFQLKDVEAALTSIADPLVEMSMLQGVNDSLESIQYADSNLGQFAINAAVSYLTQGLTNTLMGQMERSFEDSRMQTYVDKDSDLPDWLQRTLGKASAKTPGLDYNQIPYINAWGEEEENPSTALNLVYNLLSPSYFDKGRDDDLTRELNRLNDAQSENVYPSTPNKTVTINKQAYNLSAEEYVSVAKLRGQTQKQLVEDIVSSGDYAQLSDEEKAKAIRYAYDYARDSALGKVIEEHPGVTTKWLLELDGDIAAGIIRHVATGTTTKYKGLSVSDASYVTELLDGLYAEAGKTNVRDIQRIEAITGADDQLTDAQQKQVLKDTLSESAYDKYLRVLDLGMDNDDYAATYRVYLDEKDKGGKGTKNRIVAEFRKDLGVSESVAELLYNIYAGKK